MSKFKGVLLAGALVAGLAIAAHAAGLFTNGLPLAGGSQYPGTLPLTGNETIPADTNLTQGLNPASEAITTAQLMLGAGTAFPRNYLDNGAMNVNQQGTGIQTCGTATAPVATAFAADRFFCDVNVVSGAGRSQIITSAPALPAGFGNEVSLYRTSGALLQPVCIMQALPVARSRALAGQYVLFSAWLANLGALSSAGGAVNFYLISGTASEEGFGTLTASPAITPAWTGLTGGSVANATWNVTTTMTRYDSNALLVPTGVAEVGIEVCFTPGATGAGTTDGIAMTGAQLEVVATAAVNSPSAFEFHPFSWDLREAQRYFWQLNEPANGAAVNGFGQATGATATSWTLFLPAQMRGTTPVVAIPTTGTFKTNIAGTPTTWVTPTAGVCGSLACTITGGNTNTAGQAETLTGGGGSGVVTVASDKIM